MKNNSENTEEKIFNLWEKAGNALNNQQQLNKENMETLLNKTSNEFSSNQKTLLKADAIFKVAIISGFIIISAFNLDNLFVMITSLICILIATFSIKQERFIIGGLDELNEFRGNIRDQFEQDIQFYKTNLFRYPMVLATSVFLFYILGSLIYHSIQYEVIRPIEDLEDGIVLLSFLIASFIFAFAVYYPFLKSRINYLNSLLKDIEHDEKISNHMNSEESRKKKMAVITTIFIVIGILILIALIVTLG